MIATATATDKFWSLLKSTTPTRDWHHEATPEFHRNEVAYGPFGPSAIPRDVRGQEDMGDWLFLCFINLQCPMQQMLQKIYFRMHRSFNKSQRQIRLSVSRSCSDRCRYNMHCKLFCAAKMKVESVQYLSNLLLGQAAGLFTASSSTVWAKGRLHSRQT